MTKPVRFPTVPPVHPRNGFGTTALVLGIVGAALGLVPLLGLIAIVLGLLALVFGLLGWSNTHRQLATNKGMAVSGTILGAVALALGIWGMVIVSQAVDDLDRDLDELERELSSIPTPAPAT
jgi:hypothetical protein